jgi:hypothetical protein
LTGYAYETIPNRAIVTGKTKGPDAAAKAQYPAVPTLTTPSQKATLAALALGAPGLSIWRGKESLAEQME